MKLYIVQKFDSWYDYGNVEEERFYKDKTKAELSIAGKNTKEEEGDWYKIIEVTTED
tara:strand:- start:460 stop:630 length:171 start_codon:yes stop_codon:yes gene_type:complete